MGARDALRTTSHSAVSSYELSPKSLISALQRVEGSKEGTSPRSEAYVPSAFGGAKGVEDEMEVEKLSRRKDVEDSLVPATRPTNLEQVRRAPR